MRFPLVNCASTQSHWRFGKTLKFAETLITTRSQADSPRRMALNGPFHQPNSLAILSISGDTGP